jgi:hypothetical protein
MRSASLTSVYYISEHHYLLQIEICTDPQNLTTEEFRNKDSMGTTQNLRNWDIPGSEFSEITPPTQKISFGNGRSQSSHPKIPDS